MKWVTAPMVLRMAGAVVPAAGQESPVSTTATGAGVGYEQALRDLHAGRDTVLETARAYLLGAAR